MHQDASLTPIERLPPAPPSAAQKIFFGPDGLRAGWSLLLFIMLFVAFSMCVNFVGHALNPAAARTSRAAMAKSMTPALMAFEYLTFFITLLSSWIMSKLERRPISIYGLGGNRKLPNFFMGLAWGITCLTLLIAILIKTRLLVIDSRLLSGSNALRYGAIWLLGFLGVGLFEEYLSRGYLQFTLTRGLAGFYQWAFKSSHSKAWGFWTSAVASALLFAAT